MRMNKKGNKNIVIIILAVVIAGALGYVVFQKRPAPPATPRGEGYPYIVKPLAPTQLEALRSEFEASNKNVCTEINEYGFTEHKYDCVREMVRKEITDEARVIEMAKNWLVKNSKFTGVTNKADLVVGNVRKIDTCIIKCATPNSKRQVSELEIFFPQPAYNGLPVEDNTRGINIYANADGVSGVEGYRLPAVTVPLEPRISEASAKVKLIGKIFTFGDIGGKARDYRVKKEVLNNSASKVVFVKGSAEGLEFRLAWKILLGQGGQGLWTVYSDAITGEELEAVQNFQT